MLVEKSLHSLKQARFDWHNKRKAALFGRDFIESILDPCVCITNDMIILTYVDDCILLANDTASITTIIKLLRSGSGNFIFTEEGTLSASLSVDVDTLLDGSGFFYDSTISH